MVMSKDRSEYGDWQTPYQLAERVCRLLKNRGVAPVELFEPTCGTGTFIRAALEVFTTIKRVYAVEIYQPYLEQVQALADLYPEVEFHLFCHNIFDFDFRQIRAHNLLVLGNPPWVTNSKLSVLNSTNVPPKSNVKRHQGLDALTGKSNFDLAEYIVSTVLQSLSSFSCSQVREVTAEPDVPVQFALLVKNSVIKKLVWDYQNHLLLESLAQFEINALKEFGAAVNASLFVGTLSSRDGAAGTVVETAAGAVAGDDTSEVVVGTGAETEAVPAGTLPG